MVWPVPTLCVSGPVKVNFSGVCSTCWVLAGNRWCPPAANGLIEGLFTKVCAGFRKSQDLAAPQWGVITGLKRGRGECAPEPGGLGGPPEQEPWPLVEGGSPPSETCQEETLTGERASRPHSLPLGSPAVSALADSEWKQRAGGP